jgi:hypothetical protein
MSEFPELKIRREHFVVFHQGTESRLFSGEVFLFFIFCDARNQGTFVFLEQDKFLDRKERFFRQCVNLFFNQFANGHFFLSGNSCCMKTKISPEVVFYSDCYFNSAQKPRHCAALHSGFYFNSAFGG